MTGFAPKYDLFVFDWDGTVMDTTALIAQGIQQPRAKWAIRAVLSGRLWRDRPRLAKRHPQGRA